MQINVFPAAPDPEVYAHIEQRVRQEAARSIEQPPSRSLFQLPGISDRIAYILQARREIELRIRQLLLDTGGGWAGSSMAGTDTYLEYLHNGGLITDETFNRINDLFFFTTPILYGSEVSDDIYLTVQYLVRELIEELDQIYHQNVPQSSDN